MTSLFPLRESLVRDIPAGDGNIEKLFLWCNALAKKNWRTTRKLYLEAEAFSRNRADPLSWFATHLALHHLLVGHKAHEPIVASNTLVCVYYSSCFFNLTSQLSGIYISLLF